MQEDLRFWTEPHENQWILDVSRICHGLWHWGLWGWVLFWCDSLTETLFTSLDFQQKLEWLEKGWKDELLWKVGWDQGAQLSASTCYWSITEGMWSVLLHSHSQLLLSTSYERQRRGDLLLPVSSNHWKTLFLCSASPRSCHKSFCQQGQGGQAQSESDYVNSSSWLPALTWAAGCEHWPERSLWAASLCQDKQLRPRALSSSREISLI